VIVIVDNYDSFTFNLFQLVGQLSRRGERPLVVRNDALDLPGLLRLRPSHVLLSPGPGHPADSHLSLRVLESLDIPVLGICLGHQALALVHGARIGRSARPMHGRAVAVRHDASALFRGQPARLQAGLYHSLAVEPESLPAELIASAWSEHGDIMALRHAHRPHFGVQFHPESFLTPTGRVLVQSFLDL